MLKSISSMKKLPGGKNMTSADTLLAKAQELLRERKYRELTSVCKLILKKEADNEFALHEMGKYHYYSKNYEEAEKYLEKATEKYVKKYQYLGPGQCDMILDYGKCLIKNNQLDKALAVYDEYLDSEDIQARALREEYYMKLAILCFYNRKTSDAIKCLDYYLKHKPDTRRILNTKIDLLLMSCNNTDELKKIYDEKMVMERYERLKNRFFIRMYDIDVMDSAIDDETLLDLAESLDLSINVDNLIDRWYVFAYAYALNNGLDEKMAGSFANMITRIFTNCMDDSRKSKYYDEEKIFERILEIYSRYNMTEDEIDNIKPLIRDVLHIYKDNFEGYSKKSEELKLEISYSLYEKFRNVPGRDAENKFRKILYDYYENKKAVQHDGYDEYCKHISYTFRDSMLWKKLYSKDGNQVLYDGFTLNNKPCGLGTEYDIHGNKYKEGIYDIKGLVQGREYYPNGQVRFEGTLQINRSYGPNYPSRGNYYDENGKLLFSGKFQITKSNVGIPRVLIPRNYQSLLHDNSELTYLSWNDIRNLE